MMRNNRKYFRLNDLFNIEFSVNGTEYKKYKYLLISSSVSPG